MELLNILEEYGKLINWGDKMNHPVMSKLPIDDASPAYISTKSGEQCDMLYKNLHVKTINSPNQRLVSVSIKHNSNVWSISEDGEVQNDEMEVYLWYDMKVLGDRWCMNVIFNPGNWNEYVYKTLKELVSIIRGYTRASQFNVEYQDYKNEVAN